MKNKKWIYWLLSLIVAGALLGIVIFQSMVTYLDLQLVYVANKEIPVNNRMTAGDFETVQMSRRNVPADAITEATIAEVEGKVARTTILQGQVLVQRAVSNATTVREITQNISEDFVSMTIPVDGTDVPISEIANGDVISLIGTIRTNNEEGEEVISEYIAENVLVAKTVDDSRAGHSKILVLVPRGSATLISTALAVGKIRVAIDPRPFQSSGGAVQ